METDTDIIEGFRKKSSWRSVKKAVTKATNKTTKKIESIFSKKKKSYPQCSYNLTDKEALCCLMRYDDLKNALGTSGRTSLDKAKTHWKTYGCKENRTYTCPASCNINLTDVQAQCYLNNNVDLQNKFGKMGQTAINKAKEHWKGSGCYQNKNITCKTYSMVSSDFNSDIYKNSYCNTNANDMSSLGNNELSGTVNDIIFSKKVGSENNCKNLCQSDSSCVYYNYLKNSKTCNYYRSYPKTMKANTNILSGIKNSVGPLYTNMSINDKKKIKEFCIKAKLDTVTKDCFKDTRQASGNNYIDFDSQCVWSKKGGELVNTSTYDNKLEDTEVEKSPIIDSYMKKYNNLQTNKTNYSTQNKSLGRYDYGFGDWINLRRNELTALKDTYFSTVKDESDYQLLVNSVVSDYIGSDQPFETIVEEEGFRNYGSMNRIIARSIIDDDKDKTKNYYLYFFIVLILLIFIYFYVIRKN